MFAAPTLLIILVTTAAPDRAHRPQATGAEELQATKYRPAVRRLVIHALFDVAQILMPLHRPLGRCGGVV